MNIDYAMQLAVLHVTESNRMGRKVQRLEYYRLGSGPGSIKKSVRNKGHNGEIQGQDQGGKC